MARELWRGQAETIRETPKAILVEVEGEEFWIPKSQIDDESEVWQDDQEGELVIPLWLAEEKGLC